MNTIYIRSVPDELLEKIDGLAKKKNVSRNQLVLDILTTYVDMQDEKLHKLLPPIVQSEIKEELKRYENSIKDALNILLAAALKLSKSNDKLNSFLFPELEKLNIDGMTAPQILAIINSYPRENDEEFAEDFLLNEVDF